MRYVIHAYLHYSLNLIRNQNIAALLRYTAEALKTLGKQIAEEERSMTGQDDRARAQIFQSSMEDFLRTLRTINVGMKRQIWGLEEARIIKLEPKDSQTTRDEGGEVQAAHLPKPIKPDGEGKIGGLDVGWLNSRSHKVESAMEADLWREAETHLGRLLRTVAGDETSDETQE